MVLATAKRNQKKKRVSSSRRFLAKRGESADRGGDLKKKRGFPLRFAGKKKKKKTITAVGPTVKREKEWGLFRGGESS